MRKQLGIILAAVLYFSGLIKFARWRMQRNSQSLIILNYHRAMGGNLRRHLLYLQRHYRIMHLEEALDELYDTNSGNKSVQDRRTKLSLTFDDGYSDNYTHAFKLACELQIPITIFLIPGYIASGKPFWWLEGDRLANLTQVEKVKIKEYVYQLEKSGERDKLTQTIDNHLREAQSVAEREEFLSHLYEALMISSNIKVEDGARSLTWEEISKMKNSGWVSFGAHTMNHPVLAKVTGTDEVKFEVCECRRVLEQHLQHSIRTFAYPIGRLEHISEVTVQAVRESGYSWAVTTINGVSTSQSDPFRLERVLGDVSRNWLVMAAEVSGIWKLFSPLWKNAIFGFGER